MKNCKNERLTVFYQYLKNEGLVESKKDFAEKLGKSSAQISNYFTGTDNFSEKIVRQIQKSFPMLNGEWLEVGHGSMLKSEQSKEIAIVSKTVGIPLVPIDVVAGFQDGDNDGITVEQCERYVVPEFEQKGVEFLTRVSGSSMLPKYNNGDILACKKIRELTFIQWGKIYVLDTVQGALVKRLYEDPKSSDRVICKSDNSERYKDFSIPISEIRSISIVLGVIRLE